MEKLIFIATYLFICVWYYKNAKDFGTEPTVDLSQLKLDAWKAEQKRRVEILRRGCTVAGDLNAFSQESVELSKLYGACKNCENAFWKN